MRMGIKVIDLAKELGVTSRDIMQVAKDLLGGRARAFTSLADGTAHLIRVRLGGAREIPPIPVEGRQRIYKPASQSAQSSRLAPPAEQAEGFDNRSKRKQRRRRSALRAGNQPVRGGLPGLAKRT